VNPVNRVNPILVALDVASASEAHRLAGARSKCLNRDGKQRAIAKRLRRKGQRQGFFVMRNAAQCSFGGAFRKQSPKCPGTTKLYAEAAFNFDVSGKQRRGSASFAQAMQHTMRITRTGLDRLPRMFQSYPNPADTGAFQHEAVQLVVLFLCHASF